jgi:hypothetical protein
LDLAARHYFLPVRCLERALVLQALLRATGRAAELRIGVCREEREAGIRAHAWLEQGGRAFAEPVEPELSFLPLAAFPGAA